MNQQANKEKIVFFDVDGILTYIDSGSANEGIDESRVALLKEILDRTGGEAVIISSWKGYRCSDGTFYRPHIFHTLEAILLKHGIRIFGETEYISPVLKTDAPPLPENGVSIEELARYGKEAFEPGTGRAQEVHDWLSAHPEVSNFVILDDEDHDWAFYGYDPFWIRPSWYEPNGGLKQEHVEKAVRILGCLPDKARDESYCQYRQPAG